MKKSLLALSVAGLFLLSACGPSAEEKAAEAKRVQDSIDAVNAAAAEKAYQDSMAMVAEAQAAAEKAAQDSIAAAEEAAKGKKGATKPASKPAKEEPKKVEPQKQGGSLKDKVGAETQNATDAGKKEGENAPKKLKDKLK
ncbi:MAG TPA: hypothetical protein PKC85_02375 [Bacteroidia bacterium]|jgi:transposase|nr:hypothetical protein [Bacteroidia bacterium]HMU18666.1 hypothetical protein [Bacteroidia bacterium]